MGFWIAFAVACVAAALLEDVAGRQIDPDKERSPLLGTLFQLDSVYQHLVTAGPRPVVPRFTALVEIRQGVEPTSVSLTNVCGQRAFLARVIRTLRSAARRPTVIALDKFFGPTSCPTGDPGTTALVAEMQAAVEAGIGIVVGRALFYAPDGTIQSEPVLDFGLRGHPRFREAVVNTQDDVRAVPLSWTYSMPPDPARQKADTLALAAASLHRPDLVDENRLVSQSRDSGEPLSVAFLAPEQFATRRVSALRLVCGGAPGADWTTCPENSAVNDVLGGGVVLIGEQFRDFDSHATPIGRVPGYLLQASYIEALLDDRYFRTVPGWVNWGAGLGILIAFEAIFIRYHRLYSIIWRAVALVGGAMLAAYAIVTMSGYLIAPMTVSIIGMLARVLGLFVRPFETSRSH